MINTSNNCFALFFYSIEALNPLNSYYYKWGSYRRNRLLTFEKINNLLITGIIKFTLSLL